jgi:luciferase family oxidoreductase group 1
MKSPVPLSVLDVVPLRTGVTPAQAMVETVALARRAEALGYTRYWFAEHHGMEGIASAAPAVLVGQVAAATSTMRVGSGGVMLPNHSPLAIAEQFGTLEALFPGRIDLGLGRAPGSDPLTAAVLRRSDNPYSEPELPRLLAELWGFFRGDFPADHPYSRIHAVPARGNEPPVWLLGSSDYSAQLAGKLGLPFAFAHHFSQGNTLPALALYRECFTPSSKPGGRAHPFAIVAATVVLADTAEEARRLALPHALAFLRLRQGKPGRYPSLADAAAAEARLSPNERAFVDDWMAANIVGAPATVRPAVDKLLRQTAADELMVLCAAPDPAARERSYELLAHLWD